MRKDPLPLLLLLFYPHPSISSFGCSGDHVLSEAAAAILQSWRDMPEDEKPPAEEELWKDREIWVLDDLAELLSSPALAMTTWRLLRK